METRAERHAKYRSSIANMPQSEIEALQESAGQTSVQEVPEQDPAFEALSEKANLEYLKRRRREWIVKLIVGIVLVLGLLIWAFFLFGRAQS